MIKDFKEFVLRGNVVDLAVGVVIGAAFGAIVTAMVTDIFNPLIGLLHIPDLRDAGVDFAPKGDPKGDLRYGVVINAVLSFLITAAFVFFAIVRPLNHLMGRNKAEPDMRECPHCLTSIKKAATVCSACTRDVPAMS